MNENIIKNTKKIVNTYKVNLTMYENYDALKSYNENFDNSKFLQLEKKIHYVNKIIDNFSEDEKLVFNTYFIKGEINESYYSRSTYYYKIKKISQKFMEYFNDNMQ